MTMAEKTARVFSLADAALAGPPPAGNLAVPMFSHGTLDVEWYAPQGEDCQTPHARDELYVVASGTGEFYDGAGTQQVTPGTCIFVPAGIEHRFERFTDDFAVWVFFYGPEGGEDP